MTEPLGVLFEDPHCLAVAKPAGVATQGPPGDEATLEAAVRRHLAPDDPGSAYLGTVHRLDRPVSGVVVWAKTPKAARRLAAQFARREAAKEYWAIVETSAPELGREGTWDDWLSPSAESGVVRVLAPDAAGARRAITRFRRGRAVALPEGCAWLRLWPETGRTHQLRAQAAAREMAVVGDVAYGSTRPFARGIALHARALRVAHPVSRAPLTWVAPVPDDWTSQGIALPEATAFGS
jgi:23S rRNA pseudouridine1911/1915/1917 synthase